MCDIRTYLLRKGVGFWSHAYDTLYNTAMLPWCASLPQSYNNMNNQSLIYLVKQTRIWSVYEILSYSVLNKTIVFFVSNHSIYCAWSILDRILKSSQLIFKYTPAFQGDKTKGSDMQTKFNFLSATTNVLGLLFEKLSERKFQILCKKLRTLWQSYKTI